MDFINQLFDYIKVVVNFLINIVNGLFQLVKMIPSIYEFMGTLTAYIPSYALAFFMVSMSLGVVLMIVGRKNG